MEKTIIEWGYWLYDVVIWLFFETWNWIEQGLFELLHLYASDWITTHTQELLANYSSLAITLIVFFRVGILLLQAIGHILSWLVDLIFRRSGQAAEFIIHQLVLRIGRSIAFVFNTIFAGLRRLLIGS